MSDTPKTDAFEALVNRPMDWWDWARQLERENADLHDTIDAVIEADERAVDLWRAAHPGKELVIPDRAKLVGWLLEQNAALRAHAERVGQANDRLAVENDELRKDKERLDYIFWPSCSRKARARMLKLIGTPGYRDDQGGMLAWRVAIDDARKEGK